MEQLVPFEAKAFSPAAKGARGICSVNGCSGRAVMMLEARVSMIRQPAHSRFSAYCSAHAAGWDPDYRERTLAGQMRRAERMEWEKNYRREQLKNSGPHVRFRIALVGGGSVPGLTVASHFPSLGRGRHGSGSLVHRTKSVGIIWDNGSPHFGALWICGELSSAVRLMDEMPGDVRACKKCMYLAGGFVPAPSVYYALRDGLLKIGYSGNPAARVTNLNAQMLAVEPGDRETERERHAQFQHLRVVGEWFRPEPELLGFIAGLQREAA